MTHPLTNITIPTPNPALAEVLKSSEIRSAVHDVVEKGEALYREDVAKRTGRLAASTHVSTEIGGSHSDRWIGVLTVGGTGAQGTVLYALAHEFGVGKHAQSSEDVPDQPAAEDLQRVLEALSVAGRL